VQTFPDSLRSCVKIARFSVPMAVALLGSCALGQSALPTSNFLTRTFMVQSVKDRGAIFSIDVDDREYWITAKHILTGAKHPPYGNYDSSSATLDILNPGMEGQQWITESFSVIDPGKDIDILVLATAKPLLGKPSILNTGSAGVTMGGECAFLGFPYGGGWRVAVAKDKPVWFPYVKHCFVSSLVPQDGKFWVLDGINNQGFSGGPVLYNTGPQQTVFAVISGYHTEPADVIPESPAIPTPTGLPIQETKPVPQKADSHGKETVNVNSGFIIAFDLQPAIDAIRKNPIGPLRAAQ
jgi:hypothetical protein